MMQDKVVNISYTKHVITFFKPVKATISKDKLIYKDKEGRETIITLYKPTLKETFIAIALYSLFILFILLQVGSISKDEGLFKVLVFFIGIISYVASVYIFSLLMSLPLLFIVFYLGLDYVYPYVYGLLTSYLLYVIALFIVDGRITDNKEIIILNKIF